MASAFTFTLVLLAAIAGAFALILVIPPCWSAATQITAFYGITAAAITIPVAVGIYLGKQSGKG